MARIAFIGLGNMGGGMAANLAKAGHDVRAFDLSEDALLRAEARGASRLGEATQAAADLLARRFGRGPIEGRIRAHVVTAIR